MAEDKTGLGNLITSDQARDAVHIAIAPVTAFEKLYPAQPIGFIRDGDTESVRATKTPIGIVDPFLQNPVFPGERFWMFLFPGSITSLRHDWTHSAFGNAIEAPPPRIRGILLDEDSKLPKSQTPQRDQEALSRYVVSKLWLEDFALNGGNRISFEELLEAANGYLRDGEYICEGGRWEGCYVPDEFWDHFENVTGLKAESTKRGSFFSCSC